MVSAKADTQVGIIGGGPGGASMAAYLARAGVKCVVFESELFPRPHVGESLVPSSTRVFRELDFLRVMERERFPHKYGASWTAASGRVYGHDWEGVEDMHMNPDGGMDLGAAYLHPAGPQIRFDEREQPDVFQKHTYHVDRGRFDMLLLQHAHQLGAEVYEGVRVSGVEFDGGPPRVRYRIAGREVGTTCDIVIDASGRRTLLGNQLKLRIRDDVFDQFAIHTWFENYDRKAWARKAEEEDYIFIHFLPISNTWVWQIPISDSVTSIGVVTQRQNFAKTRESREQFFWDTLSCRPEVYERLRAAERIRPFKEEGDYSYAMKQIAGDRWLMVGDAGRFVDPIFSTGVSIALNSSRYAHTEVIRALETGNVGRDAFSGFETTIRRGMRNWYDFISVYYRLNVLFTHFITDTRYRVDVIKLLQGDVYDEEAPPVLDRMREMVSMVERTPTHVWHKLLNDLTNDAFRPAF